MRTSALLGAALIALLSASAGLANPSDQVSLDNMQKALLARGAIAPAQAAPPDFHASVGASVPPSLILYAFGVNLEGLVPAAKQYDYVNMPSQNLLLVDPKSRKVVAMIDLKSAAGSK